MGMQISFLDKVAGPVKDAGVKIVGKFGPVVSRKSPEILLGAGIFSIGAGVVLACRATLKAKERVEKGMDEAEKAKEAKEFTKLFADNEEHEVAIPVEDVQLKVRKIHLKTGFSVVGKFVLPAMLIGTGVTCIVVSHNIQAKRLVAAVASLDALQLSFEQYRRNVIADQGPSADLRYLTGDQIVKADFYEESEDGKVKKVKKEVKVRKGCSDPYVKLFDECNSTEWRKSRGFNLDFIQCQEAYFNRKLRLQGHVFLNDVYEALGFGYDPIGQFTGWILGGDGDDQIVFEVEETYDWEELELAKEEKRNPEPSFWVTFNVDGEIWDKIN